LVQRRYFPVTVDHILYFILETKDAAGYTYNKHRQPGTKAEPAVQK
jgi:hypothetical protein